MPQTIKNFRQGQDLAIYKMKAAGVRSGGVCMAISAYYLVAQHKGDGFWKWFGHVRNKVEIINVHAISGTSRSEENSEVVMNTYM